MNALQHVWRGTGTGMTADLQNALLIHNHNAGNGGHSRRRLLDRARHLLLQSTVFITTYSGEGVRVFFRYKCPHFRVISGCRKISASLVIVGRTQNYGFPFKITTEANLFEDQFEILTLSTRSGLRYLSYLPSLWLNKLRGTAGVHFFKSDSLLCEPLDANAVYAQIDGEPLARLPVEFRIVPRALKLLVPNKPVSVQPRGPH